MTTPKPLTDAQLAALDWVVDMGGDAIDGHSKLRKSTAGILYALGCLAPTNKEQPPRWVGREWRITEKGYEERAKAHEARNGR